MLRVGVVSEGVSDFLVLQVVMRSVRPDAEFFHLHPQDDSLLGRGWKGVRAWCSRNAPALETLMAEFPGGPLALVVVHADCSMADKVGADRPCPPSLDTATALAAVVGETWLGRKPCPPSILIATPAMTIDTWVVATLEPLTVDLATIECNEAAEDELVKPVWGPTKKLRRRDGEIKKPRSAYGPFAERVAANLPLVLARCPRAEAFRAEFARAVAHVPPI